MAIVKGACFLKTKGNITTKGPSVIVQEITSLHWNQACFKSLTPSLILFLGILENTKLTAERPVHYD